ncbi:hypothetical protein PENSPDRAFT_508796 [Peniophora sp. CONT]|nr:hypothetical protein PENSPDRAFT_508796 [Peniophora sp. CONT]
MCYDASVDPDPMNSAISTARSRHQRVWVWRASAQDGILLSRCKATLLLSSPLDLVEIMNRSLWPLRLCLYSVMFYYCASKRQRRQRTSSAVQLHEWCHKPSGVLESPICASLWLVNRG